MSLRFTVSRPVLVFGFADEPPLCACVGLYRRKRCRDVGAEQYVDSIQKPGNQSSTAAPGWGARGGARVRRLSCPGRCQHHVPGGNANRSRGGCARHGGARRARRRLDPEGKAATSPREESRACRTRTKRGASTHPCHFMQSQQPTSGPQTLLRAFEIPRFRGATARDVGSLDLLLLRFDLTIDYAYPLD
jgi:hypothetical protein